VRQPSERDSAAAYLVWAVGLAVYFLAVFHRSSLAVAGLAAAERFDITAAQLSTFTMLQLVVYAGMQVPVGLLIDRFGARAVMVTGTAVMALAQGGFALAESYPTALVARIFVGLGDAMTFTAVLRQVNEWFSPRRIPLVTQLTGVVGQAGALVAALPMTWALSHLGWTKAYGLAAVLGVVMTVLAAIVIHDTPQVRSLRGPALSWTTVRDGVARSWAEPGTRTGFWVHFTTQFSGTALSMLWGYPFLVRGEHLSQTQAGLLLTVMVLATISAGPVIGAVVARHPWYRSSLAMAVVLAIATVWTVVLVWPGDAPPWLLVLLVVVVGVGGPASMIGFDLGRSFNPSERLSTATGIINQGGFLASLVLVVAIGLVLDWRTPGASTAYTPEAFRWAMSCQYVLWTLGVVQIWRNRRRARAVLLEQDPDAKRRMTGLG
jgi:nitrate/nitrite transporter NarK